MEVEQWTSGNNKTKDHRNVKIIRYTVSSILAFVGIALLANQAFPLAMSYLRGRVIEKSGIIASPIPTEYAREIEGNIAYYDPGSSYFENLIQAAGKESTSTRVYNPVTKTYKETVINEGYTRNFELSIPSLNIENINVNPNVESYDEDIYNQVLKNGLAHFKGTPIPGDGGNSFIYGHSAVDSYFSDNSSNPETIFTKLEQIEVGDEVHIQKEGRTLKYVVRKKKIVQPTDFSILSQEVNREKLTLMTCHPAGLPTNRLIVTADLIDG